MKQLKLDDLQKKIEKRAYELYLQRSGGHGKELDDWLIAEQELTGKNKKEIKSKKKK